MTVSLLVVDDAFTRAVADARERLSAREGRTVSWRELVRRAGFEEEKAFGKVAYHLLPRDRDRGQHLVPLYIIDAMAKVLPISRAELMRAAAEAAGFEVATATGEPQSPEDVVVLVTRLLGDEDVDQAERDRIGLEVMGAITRAMQRGRERGEDTPNA